MVVVVVIVVVIVAMGMAMYAMMFISLPYTKLVGFFSRKLYSDSVVRLPASTC
jgi:hypothetical protein